jgi:hypothetical protein
MVLARLLNRATNLGQAVSIISSSRSPTVIRGPLLVAAEYLAKGYKLSDKILQRAIQVDGELGRCLLSYRGVTSNPNSRERNLETLPQLLSVSRFLDWS